MEFTRRPDTTGVMRTRLSALAFAVLLGAAACSGGASEDASDTTIPDTEVDAETTTTHPDPLMARGFGSNRPAGGEPEAPEGEVGSPTEVAEANESFEPAANVGPVESVVPMYEG
jgi:hypothetical protein